MIPIVYLRFSDGSQGVATPKMRADLASFLALVEARGKTWDLRRSVTLDVGGDVVLLRELDPSQPQDQREIWRLAALALGATEEQALSAVVVPYAYFGHYTMVLCWGAPVEDARLPAGSRRVRWANVPNAADVRATLTRALCARVWP